MESKNYKYKLYGAILGDLCGQPFEYPTREPKDINPTIHNPNSHITDDSLLTLATAFALMNNITFEAAYKHFAKNFMDKNNTYGFGSRFIEWTLKPLGSISYSNGNGCLMRISPIIYANIDDVNMDMMIGASVYNSHANVDSYNACINLKNLYLYKYKHVYQHVEPFTKIETNATKTIDTITKIYHNTLTTDNNNSNDILTNAILNTVKLGGDTDTNASIIGELINYDTQGISDEDANYVENKLLEIDDLLLNIIKDFNQIF